MAQGTLTDTKPEKAQAPSTPSTAPAKAGATPEAVQSWNPSVVVGKQIQNMLQGGTLDLPRDYSFQNALKAAYLKLVEKPENGKAPLIETCSRESITKALLSMVVQGLNPMKDQCYFIPYGGSLSCQRSYHGDIAVAKRVRPGIEFYFAVVREGEAKAFQYTTERGKTFVINHPRSLESEDTKVVGAYAGIRNENDEDEGCVLLTIDRIKKSWSMSKTYGRFENTPHVKFEAEMAIRTVVRKCAIGIIRTSSDALLMEHIQEQEQLVLDAEIAEEVEAGSLSEPLALDPPTSSVDTSTGEIMAEETVAVAEPEQVKADF